MNIDIDWTWYELGGLIASVVAAVLFSIQFVLILLGSLGVLK
jgi:hypothetical protein